MAVADAISNSVFLSSSERTATANSAVFDAEETDFYICVDITVAGGTLDLTPQVQLFDSTANKFFTVWGAAAALTGVTTSTPALYLLTSDSGISETDIAANTNEIKQAFVLKVPERWRFRMLAGNSITATYSVTRSRVRRVE